MIKESLRRRIESSRTGPAYQVYLQVRERVLEMMEEARKLQNSPSDYWAQEVAGFEYMLDASPMVIDRLRDHCYHLTGILSLEYRVHHANRSEPFASKLAALKTQDSRGLFVPESPEMGGFGHLIDGNLVNIDTFKFYECLIAMDKAGLLSGLDANTRELVLEIGAGWGGFAYQFKTLFPKVAYVIVDLPQTLLFSAVYLKTIFPKASCVIYGEKPLTDILRNCSSYDFLFLPHYAFETMDVPKFDLAINIASFQEMMTNQVESYANKLKNAGCKRIYSLNRDRSRYNAQLTTVSEVLARYYRVNEVKVLPVPYTQLSMPHEKSTARSYPSLMIHPREAARLVKAKAVRMLLGRSRQKDDVYQYRHLVGILPGS